MSDQVQIKPGTAFPAEWVADDRPLPPVPVPSPSEITAPTAPADAKPNLWPKVLGGALAVLVSLVIGVAFYDWIAGLFARSTLLGWAAIGTVAASIGSLGVMAWREWRQLRSLDSIAALRERARARLQADTPGEGMAVIGAVLRALPTQGDAAGRIAEFRAMVHGAMADRQALQLFERTVLKPLDDQAQAVIVRAARNTAVGVSISPVAALDVLITVGRSLRMIRDIAAIYGFRPGAVATVSLARRLFVTAAANAALDIAGTMWGEHLGGRVAGVLSAKLGEGIITAVRTARLGLATMEACRPLPFADDQRPGLAHLRKQVMAGLSP